MRMDYTIFEIIDRGIELAKTGGAPLNIDSTHSSKSFYVQGYVERLMSLAIKAFTYDDHRVQEQITSWVENFVHDIHFDETLAVNGMRFDIVHEGRRRHVVAGNNEDQILAEISTGFPTSPGIRAKVELHPEWIVSGSSNLDFIDYEGEEFRTSSPMDVAEVIRLAVHMYSQKNWSSF